MDQHELLSLKDSEFSRQNLLMNYCLLGDEELLIRSFISNNRLVFKFDADCYYFLVTGAHKKTTKRLSASDFSAGVDYAEAAYQVLNKKMEECGYRGTPLHVKFDNSRQMAVIFSQTEKAVCTPQEMAEYLVEAFRSIKEPRPNHQEEYTSSFAGPYSGYEQLHDAYLKCRELIELSFFGVQDQVITAEFRQNSAVFCDTITVYTNARRFIQLFCNREKNKALKHVDFIVNTLIAPSYSMENYLALYSSCEDLFAILKSVYGEKASMLHKKANEFLTLEEYRVYLREMMERMYEALEDEPHYSPTILMALSFVNRNYDVDISLSQVSEYVYGNVSRLSSDFNREVGMSFSDYVAYMRVKKAEELLRSTELTVAEIARRVNYPSVKYFREVFKRHTGKTPVEIRKE